MLIRNKIFIYTIYTFIPKREQREHKVNILPKIENKKRTFFYTKREHFFEMAIFTNIKYV